MEEEILKVECPVDKRRKCDSGYIKLYNELLKKYKKVCKELDDYKKLVSIYKTIMDESIDKLKGGETNEK